MKVMTHVRVRKFLRNFRDVEELKAFCSRHKNFIKKRLPANLISAVRKKSNNHYAEKSNVLMQIITTP